MNEEQFEQDARAQGYDDIRSVAFEPNSTKPPHQHDFSAFVLVLEGELEIGTNDNTRLYQPGETCTMAAGTMHSERAGANGAVALVARR